MTTTVERLEFWKSIASIVSAIAIPVVLAFVGYFIQKSLADEGIKKDYVGIAAGILKDKAADQDPDVRMWAVTVLEANSPIPLSAKVKAGLERLPEPPRIPKPPDSCMTKPKDRLVFEAHQALEKKVKRMDLRQMGSAFLNFIELVMAQEEEALRNKISLECLQNWLTALSEPDDKFREGLTRLVVARASGAGSAASR